MHYYQIYGLNVGINQALPLLPELQIEERKIGVSIDLSNVAAPTFTNEATCYLTKKDSSNGIELKHFQDWICVAFQRSDTEQLKFYLSKDGAKVVSDNPSSIPPGDIESFILGPILGGVLRLQQRICLHASVMEHEGKAFAFVGNKGAGKSTTAAALLRAGARLISDDVAVLNPNDVNDILVQPGYPGVRLLPRCLSSFGLDQHNYDRVVSGHNKRYVRLSYANKKLNTASNQDGWQFQDKACSLKVIYTLNSRQNNLNHTEILPLTKQAALMALTPHSYARSLLNSAQRADEFKYMAHLSQCVKVKSISCPNELTLLPQIANDILADVSNTQ